jgi:NosR/NirI family nitrous oxide reductase transcriptional regulator
MRFGYYISLLLLTLLFTQSVYAVEHEQRFPRPEFETAYEQPTIDTPEPRSLTLEYFDVILLVLILSLTAYFIHKKRSRKGILWLSVFSLAYYGFFREGCICSVGSVQNIALSFFNNDYAVSWTVIAFFVIPLLFTLFYGRVFCATACPLGVLQDLLLIKPIQVPKWLQKSLGLFPYIYLGFAVLYAATASDFIICRFDPFVGVFRMGATLFMMLLGIGFLVLGLFVARPYCRFVCPYGVLLNWMSQLSFRHLTITPSKCIQCNLCEQSCPFDAIEKPNTKEKNLNSPKNQRRFVIYTLLIPLWIAIGAFSFGSAHGFFAKLHPDVILAEKVIHHLKASDSGSMSSIEDIDIKTFMASERTLDELMLDVQLVEGKFHTGSYLLGGFIGLVIGVLLMQSFRFKRRNDYEPHKGDCFSCGRCMEYCPIDKETIIKS